MPNVTKMESAVAFPEFPLVYRIRVAAYARVSTTQDEQKNSFEAQKDYYEKLIKNNPEWEFAGIYADRGVTGTSCEKREGFMNMLQDCREGKIQMILTKSVSRFARNTVDSLKTIRELKSLGVGVQFEKENIFTLDSKGEFLISIMSSLSQEESRSISENVRWGMRKREADGKYSVNYSQFLGYDRGKDGKFVINPEQAAVVKAIFRLFLSGYSGTAIASKLTENGIQTGTGGERWHARTVMDKIQNESYKGDKLLQKTYTTDFLSKKQKRNRGELPQYYVVSGHKPIIDPELYDYTQEIYRARRTADHQFSGIDAFSGKMYCGLCGNYYGVRPWHKKDRVWQCREKAKKGSQCSNTYIYDYAFRFQIKEIMLRILEANKVLGVCLHLVNNIVKEEDRKNKALRYISTFVDREPETLLDGEDEYLLILERITIYPDDHIKIRLIDGLEIEHYLRPYSPKRGWMDRNQEEKK